MFRDYLRLPRTIHILCLGAFINRAGAFLLPFLTLYLRKDLGLGTEFATTAMGVFGAGSMTASFVGGHLADRIGRRTVMLMALLSAAVILVVFGFLTSVWSILLAVYLFATCADMFRPAVQAMIADLTEGEERTLAFSLNYLAINLGFAVAGSVGGFLAEYSYQLLFWGDAATAVVFAIILARLIPETLPKQVKDDSGNVSPTDQVPLMGAVRHILTDWVFLVLCGGMFCLAICYLQMNSTLPLYVEGLGYGSTEVGLILAVNGAMIVLFQIPVTALIVRYHRGWAVAISAVVVGLGFGLTSVATVPIAIAGTVVVWTIGEMMNAPMMASIVSDLAPATMRARYMGVFAMSWSTANMLGAPIGGRVLVTLGAERLWIGAACIGLLAAFLFWSIRRRVVEVDR